MKRVGAGLAKGATLAKHRAILVNEIQWERRSRRRGSTEDTVLWAQPQT
jgi:hypothetical protein